VTSRDFCYWLQGYFELDDATKNKTDYAMTHLQMVIVRNHLKMVFAHEIDPSMGPESHQDLLSKIHLGSEAKVNC
jgi:hypothetical protein